MLDHDLIKRKISLIEDELIRLTEFEDFTLNDIAKDYRSQAVVERLFERIIIRAIDINRHIIEEIGGHLRGVKKYRETFLRLADLGVYPEDFAKKIAPSGQFRNALVRDYNDLDPEIINKSIKEAIQEFNQYTQYILSFLEKRRER